MDTSIGFADNATSLFHTLFSSLSLNVPILVLAAGVIMLIVERLNPARTHSGTRIKRVYWWLRAVAFNSLQALATFLGAVTWDTWFHPGSNPVGEGLSLVSGAAVGYVVITFIYYWWHRARHASPTLWHWVHRLHHSPARIEVITSFYKHPIELILNGLLSSAILTALLGLSAEQATLAILATGLAELFYHWNVRTPRWLGWIIQRPEMHRVHHERGQHAHNFSDLPLWDLLFGTFKNPREDTAPCGFANDAEARVLALLCGRTVREAD